MMSQGRVRHRIAGADILDGTGRLCYRADLLIEDGLIAAIERDGAVSAGWDAQLVDAAGRTLCPGFIDVHSHADNAPFLNTDDTTKIAQGVTTEVPDNCGISLAPVGEKHTDQAWREIREQFPLDTGSWTTTAELFAAIDEHGTVTNVCPLIGHGTIRTAVVGAAARALTDTELRAMTDLLRSAVEAGAFGLSSGLIYPPGVYAGTDELAALAAVLPEGRVHATHMRNESNRLMDSIEESLRTVRNAGCRLQISHLKSAGRANFGGVTTALRRLDQAREDGIPVAQDVYPYDAASTSLSACLPPWMHEGGTTQILRRLHDAADLARVRAEIAAETENAHWENLIQGAGGFGGVLVASTESGSYVGRTLLQLAEDLSLEPFDALVHVLVSEALNVQMVEFCMVEDDVDTVLRSPHTAIGSDGLSPGLGGCPHPRLFGTYPRVLGRFVRERQVLDLAEAVRRMTSLPAQLFSVPNRGVVAPGMVADLVCFDPARIGHDGDYLHPAVAPSGIDWVMQAGRRVMVDGQWQGVRGGRRLQPA